MVGGVGQGQVKQRFSLAKGTPESWSRCGITAELRHKIPHNGIFAIMRVGLLSLYSHFFGYHYFEFFSWN